MNEEQNIINRVLYAQHNIDEADALIRDYFPFIKSETAKIMGRIPVEGKDDELSIALMGFHEAIESYEQGKGAFLKFAALVIKRRIIDFIRHENQSVQQVSLENTVLEEINNTEYKYDEDNIVDREAVKWEIVQLTNKLGNIGITISDVASDCPKYEKAITGCRQVVEYLIDRPEQMEILLETGKLPIRQIIEETKVKKKTIEKHRKYLVALAIIYYEKYECMTAHMSEVFKTKKGGK